jgi:hypothetical protein
VSTSDFALVGKVTVTPLVMGAALPHPASRFGIDNVLRVQNLTAMAGDEKAVTPGRISQTVIVRLADFDDARESPAPTMAKSAGVRVFSVNSGRHFSPKCNSRAGIFGSPRSTRNGVEISERYWPR